MLLAVVAVALILYRLLSGDGDEEGDEDEGNEVDDEQEADGLDNFDATQLEDLS